MAAPEHEVFQAPTDHSVPIWRYMDFTKFVSMISRKALYFPRADLLGDSFEGSLPKLNAIAEAEKLLAFLVSTGMPHAQASASWANSKTANQQWRQGTYVSCWHMSEHESAAMWKIYARTEEAVAVRTSYLKLAKETPEDVFLGVVKYINYATETCPPGNLFWPYVHKRKFFEYERELRAIVTQFDWWGTGESPAPGVWKTVNLEALIEQVYVAPTSQKWFFETVQSTVKQFGVDLSVSMSSLDETPDW